MKSIKKTAEGTKVIELMILFFLWAGTTAFVIHAAVATPDKPYWIYRAICGFTPSFLLTVLTRISINNRIKGIGFPICVFIGESIGAYLIGGDPLFFLIVASSMIISIIYLDYISGVISLVVIDLIVFLFIIIEQIEMVSGLSLYHMWMQFALFNAISICQILFCRFTFIQYIKATASKTTFEAVLAMTPNYILVTDDMAKITFVSSSLCKSVGLSNPSIVKGKPLLDLFRDPQIKLLLHSILESEQYWENSFTLPIFGETRHFFGRSCLLGESKFARLFEWSDITDLVEGKNAAVAANEAKSSFLANMSHEIRTPMNAIKSLSELMLLTKLDTVQADYATNIVGASESLLRIINDVLDFSKIDANKLELTDQEYDFISFISDVLNITNLKAAEKDLQFVTDIDPQLPSMLYGDDVRIKQVLLNLITNAVKFTEKGHVKLTIKEVERQGDKIFIEYRIKDTGIGIKKSDISQLFGVFTQVDKVKNKAIEGTGLGLAISKRLVNMMEGEIFVESEYHQGSEFFFTIPQIIRSATPIASLAGTDGLRVLLLGGGKKGEGAANILNRLSVSYMYMNVSGVVESNMEYQASYSINEIDKLIEKEKITDVMYFYQEWDSRLRALPVYQGKKLRFTAIKDIRRVSTQHTPYHFKFLFDPLIISSVATILGGGELEARTHRHVPAEDTLGSFNVIDGKVLVVDDNRVNLVVAKSVLKHYDIIPDCAESGNEAIRMCQSKKYDIVFMDHMMPDKDGIETTAEIISGGGINSETPIVALTANVVSGMKEIFLSSGMLDFISKPIVIKELNRVIKRFIPHSRLVTRFIPDGEDKTPDHDLSQKCLEYMEIGIDYRSALAAIGGSESAYINVLQTFSRTVPDKMRLLKGEVENVKRPGTDLELFRVEIHALKSALCNIGATVLSQKAKALELNAESNSINFVIREFEEFYTDVHKLLCSIVSFLPKVEVLEKQASTDSEDKLTAPLIRIKELLNGLENDEAEHETAKLAEFSYSPKIDELLDYILKAVQHFRIDEACSAIDNLLALLSENG